MPDLALAALLVAAVEAELWWYDGGPAGVAVVTTVASALHAGALAFRTSHPALMAGVMTTVLWGQAMLGGRMTTTLVTAMAGMVMIFSVGLLLPRRHALLAAGAYLAAAWFDLLVVEHEDTAVISDLVFTGVLVVGLPLFVGMDLRAHRLRGLELARVNAELEVEREETARLAALQERARIAREVHDVVAHSVSLMVVQAGAARHLLDRDPDQSRQALTDVEQVGRGALHELRATLGVLRQDDLTGSELRPQPGLAQLSTLVDQVAGGVTVTLQDRSTVQLSPSVDVAAYRIVQEALTNAVRHAPGSRVQVRLEDTRGGSILVRVTDDGPGSTSESRGYGLEGIRERTEMHGGRVHHLGPAADGGFEVAVELPGGPR